MKPRSAGEFKRSAFPTRGSDMRRVTWSGIVAMMVAVCMCSYVQAEGVDQTIREKCAREWPDDFRMRAYCEKRQREALPKLVSPATPSSDEANVIRSKCAREWPDDFRMRAYCEEKQRDGLRALSAPLDASPEESRMIRSKCAREWPGDFRMRAYCENKQIDGLPALGR